MSPQPVPHFVVRPSTKLIVPHYVIAGVFFVAAAVVYVKYPEKTSLALALLAIALIWDAATIVAHLKRRFVTLTLDHDRLRYEEGIMSKSTRSLNLAKIQDVRVDQTVMERLLAVGSLTMETAGETGRLTMANIDNPQQVADHILALSKQEGAR